MRTCWIIDSLGPGGAEALVPRFASAAAADTDLHLDVIVLRRPDIAPHAETLRRAGVTPWSADARNLRDVRAFRRLLGRLRAERPDVIHAHLRYATIWSAIASALTGIPLVATLHEMPRTAGDPLRERLLESLMHTLLRRRAAGVIAVSEAAARAVIESGRLPRSLVRVVRNGAPPPPPPMSSGQRARRRRSLGLPSGGPVLLSVSVLRPDKGLDVTIDAMPQVLARVPDATLLVVGSGPAEAALRERAARQGVGDRCVFAGRRDDVEDLYPIADMLVHTSRREALPTVVLEAMTAGLPVVATDVGGTAELVTQGVTGVLVPPDSPGDVAGAVTILLEDPERARAIGREARLRVAAGLDAGAWVERLRAVYAAAMPERPLRLGVESTRGAS